MKSKIIVLISWVISIALFIFSFIAENEFFNQEIIQVVIAGLVLIASFVGYKVLPESVKIFIKKLLLLCIKIFKKKDDDSKTNS
jgi:hypothetical protein